MAGQATQIKKLSYVSPVPAYQFIPQRQRGVGGLYLRCLRRTTRSLDGWLPRLRELVTAIIDHQHSPPSESKKYNWFRFRS